MRTICAMIVTGLVVGCGQSEPQFTSEAARREHEKMQARLQQQGGGGFETRTADVSGSATSATIAAIELMLDDYETQLNECEAEFRADPGSFPVDAEQLQAVVREGRATIKSIRVQLARNPDPETIDSATIRLLVQIDQFESLFEEVE